MDGGDQVQSLTRQLLENRAMRQRIEHNLSGGDRIAEEVPGESQDEEDNFAVEGSGAEGAENSRTPTTDNGQTRAQNEIEYQRMLQRIGLDERHIDSGERD